MFYFPMRSGCDNHLRGQLLHCFIHSNRLFDGLFSSQSGLIALNNILMSVFHRTYSCKEVNICHETLSDFLVGKSFTFSTSLFIHLLIKKDYLTRHKLFITWAKYNLFLILIKGHQKMNRALPVHLISSISDLSLLSVTLKQ